jgi:hypothetical protein
MMGVNREKSLSPDLSKGKGARLLNELKLVKCFKVSLLNC